MHIFLACIVPILAQNLQQWCFEHANKDEGEIRAAEKNACLP